MEASATYDEQRVLSLLVGKGWSDAAALFPSGTRLAQAYGRALRSGLVTYYRGQCRITPAGLVKAQTSRVSA